MQALEAAREMMEREGLTMYRVSVDTGHKPSYVQSAMRKGAIGAHVLALIADACGYDLALVPRAGGEPIRIDPAPRGEA